MTIGEKDVGSLVYLRVDGEYKAFRVMHHGKPSDLYDDSWVDGTVIMLDYTEHPVAVDMVSGFLDEKITYARSGGHNALNSTWLARLDAGVAEVIREVRLPYRSDVDGSDTVAGGSSGLAARIWLPSVIEVARGTSYYDGAPRFYVNEGAKFSYWADADLERYRLWEYEDENEDDVGWCTRTPNTYKTGDDAACFHVVRGNGMCYNGNTDQVMVRPCMVLPDEVMVDGDSYVQVGKIMHCKVGGAWKEGTTSVKVGGVWKELAQQAVKVGGAWKE